MQASAKNNLIYFLVLIALMVFTVAFRTGPDIDNLLTPVHPPKRATQLTSSEIFELSPLDVKVQLRASCYAFTGSKFAKPSNGEAHSRNLPQHVDSTFERAGLYLVINPAEFVKYGDSLLGYKLYLVNTSDSVFEFDAQDSRLNIVAQVIDDNGNWVPITYLPSSWCGNSYHSITLDTAEFWEFVIPVFNGSFQTKMRYVLSVGKRILCSNEVVVKVNREQWDSSRKQGYKGYNIMDPYDD